MTFEIVNVAQKINVDKTVLECLTRRRGIRRNLEEARNILKQPWENNLDEAYGIC